MVRKYARDFCRFFNKFCGFCDKIYIWLMEKEKNGGKTKKRNKKSKNAWQNAFFWLYYTSRFRAAARREKGFLKKIKNFSKKAWQMKNVVVRYKGRSHEDKFVERRAWSLKIEQQNFETRTNVWWNLVKTHWDYTQRSKKARDSTLKKDLAGLRSDKL